MAAQFKAMVRETFGLARNAMVMRQLPLTELERAKLSLNPDAPLPADPDGRVIAGMFTEALDVMRTRPPPGGRPVGDYLVMRDLTELWSALAGDAR